MTAIGTVEVARRALGPVGAFMPNVPYAAQAGVDEQRQAALRLESAGYSAAWVNEGVGGRDCFAQLAILLAATSRIAFASGVMNMWARPPETSHGGASYLADGFPGRFVLGLGVGYPYQAETVGRTYGSPVATAREYLTRRSVVPSISPALEAPYATVLAANGPKMLAVARDHADGALPAVQPPAFTARARDVLGPDKLLAVSLPVVADDDTDRARDAARTFLSAVLGLDRSPYAAGLRRLGYSERALAEVPDDLLEDVVAFGAPDDVAARVRAHLDAGADHVRLDPVVPDFTTGIDRLEHLAPAMPTAVVRDA